jgi:hypothetical protein
MYYWLNTFSFTTTMKEEDALNPIYAWLRRMGFQHCKSLKNVRIRIGVEDGLLIGNPNKADDVWVPLVGFMKACGCPRGFRPDVILYDDEPIAPRLAQYLDLIDKGIIQRERLDIKSWQREVYDVMDNYLDFITIMLHCSKRWSFISAIAEKYNLDVLVAFRSAIAVSEAVLYSRSGVDVGKAESHREAFTLWARELGDWEPESEEDEASDSQY